LASEAVYGKLHGKFCDDDACSLSGLPTHDAVVILPGAALGPECKSGTIKTPK